MDTRSITREDVEHLKDNWTHDPCYDLEDIEGFEDYREELIAYRQQKEAEWSKRNAEMIREYTSGIPEEVALGIIRGSDPYAVENWGTDRLLLSLVGALREQTEVQKRIAAALEKAVEVKPWEKG